MEWINVKDKLPPMEVEILVTDGTMIDIGALYEGYNEVKIWNGRHSGCLGEVTQWMPLPPLPYNE